MGREFLMIDIPAVRSNDVDCYLSTTDGKPGELHVETVGRARVGKRMQAGV